MGDNFIQEIIGKGNDILSMRMEDHEIKGVLHEVLHVLGLVKTCSQLKIAIAQGLKIEFDQDGCSIKNNVGSRFLQKSCKKTSFINYCVRGFHRTIIKLHNFQLEF